LGVGFAEKLKEKLVKKLKGSVSLKYKGKQMSTLPISDAKRLSIFLKNFLLISSRKRTQKHQARTIFLNNF